MEVKEGYKRTEVGVIPEPWGVALVAEVAERVGSGMTPTGGSRIYQKSGRPFVRSQNVGWGRMDLTEVAYIHDALHATFAASEIAGGDVLLNITGASIGRASVARREVVGGNVNQHVCIIRPNSSRLNPSFLCAVLLSALGQSQIDSYQAGGNRQGLNFGQVRKIRLPLPPLAEQRAIAESLSDVDDLIASLERLIAKKRDIKAATMGQLLTGRTRLPGFTGEWERKRLGELGEWRGGVTPPMRNPDYWIGGEFPWISSGDVKVPLLRDTSQHVTAEAIRGGAAVVVPAGSIVIVTRSGILRKYLPVALLERDMAINQDLKALIRLPSNYAPYLLHALIGFGDAILARCLKSGTTVESIEFAWLKAFVLPLPPFPEQQAIAAVLSDMDAEIEALESRLAKTRMLKQGMMQELLTGRTRLV